MTTSQSSCGCGWYEIGGVIWDQAHGHGDQFAFPKPYYEDSSVTIYHGDCREYIRHLRPDAVITDPPYGTGYYASDSDVMNAELLALFQRPCAVFGWPERLVRLCVAAGVVPDEWVTWWASNGRNRGFNRVGLWREVECVAVFGLANWGVLRQPRVVTTTKMPKDGLRGVPQTDMARMGDVWRDESPNLNPNQPPRLHPNEKPVSLMRKLITALGPEKTLDPFMGSGTTLVAAKQLGRRAIGIEIEERYCEVAARRLSQQTLGLSA